MLSVSQCRRSFVIELVADFRSVTIIGLLGSDMQ